MGETLRWGSLSQPHDDDDDDDDDDDNYDNDDNDDEVLKIYGVG